MAVITQGEARLAIPGLTVDDSGVSTLISRADAILAQWCGYPPPTETTRPTFDTSTYTRYLPGPGGRDLQLPVWPIQTVTSIEDDTTEAFDGSTYLVSSSDYATRPGGIVRLKTTATHGAWSESDNEVIKAVWTAGFTAASAPEQIKQAVVEYVAILWATRMTLGLSQAGGGGQSVSPKEPSIPFHIQQKLAPHRLIGAWGSIP